VANQTNKESEQLANQMSLLEHLEELRQRLIIVSVSILVTTVLSFLFAKQMVNLLAQPIGGLDQLQSIDVTENIGVYMKVSLTAGVILAMPIILYQFFAFIVPGLTASEKRVLFIALPAIIFLFAAGMAFAYFIMLPPAIRFLTGDTLLGIETLARPKTYFGFVTRLIFWLGVSFELPLIIGFLSRLGLVTPQFLVKNIRYAVVLVAILAALITPTPDPVNMGLAMTPLLVLYLLGIVLARMMYRPRENYLYADDDNR
jgi:sec-independent protein translocase protein TatC